MLKAGWKMTAELTVSIDDSDRFLPKLRDNIEKNGFAYIESKHCAEQFEDIGAALGKIKLRSDIKINKELDSMNKKTRISGNIKNNRPSSLRAQALALHTDRPTVNIIGFHCVRQDEESGHLTIVDTLSIAGWFSEDELARLARIKITYTDRKNGVGKEFSGLNSIVEKKSERYNIYYAPWFFPESRGQYEDSLIEKLKEFVDRQKACAATNILLSPGQSVFIDNQRMLHGREAISEVSKRHLIRLYIDTDK